jgi:hypothetical protein
MGFYQREKIGIIVDLTFWADFCSFSAKYVIAKFIQFIALLFFISYYRVSIINII